MLWGKRQCLSHQIMGIEVGHRSARVLNYERIISSQQEVIKLLQKQVSHLRQYLTIMGDFEEKKDIAGHLTSYDPADVTFATPSEERIHKRIMGFKGLITSIMKELEVQNPKQILPQLKSVVEKANHKPEPIFIERVKERQVPVYVERTVEVPVYVEKILIEDKKKAKQDVDKTRCTEAEPSEDSDEPQEGKTDETTTFFKPNKVQCQNTTHIDSNDAHAKDCNQKKNRRGRKCRRNH